MPVRRLTKDEWYQEALKHGNGDILDAAFQCPKCGNVQTPRQFKDLGEAPQSAAMECVGRILARKGQGTDQGCNWAAFGLLTTLGKGVEIVFDNHEIVNVFEFAEKEGVA